VKKRTAEQRRQTYIRLSKTPALRRMNIPEATPDAAAVKVSCIMLHTRIMNASLMTPGNIHASKGGGKLITDGIGLKLSYSIFEVPLN
jgi:hypothetical protein